MAKLILQVADIDEEDPTVISYSTNFEYVYVHIGHEVKLTFTLEAFNRFAGRVLASFRVTGRAAGGGGCVPPASVL